MTIEQRLKNLELQVKHLNQSILQMSKNDTSVVAKVDDTSNRVAAITPYTETKTAYSKEKEKTFYNVPQGKLFLYFSNYSGSYSVSHIEDRVRVTFDILTEQTDITIEVR